MTTVSTPSAPLCDDAGLTALARRLGDALRARRLSLVTAESCTGGWIAKVITDIAGSSEWFDGGLVVYGNALKQALLGVQATTLRRHGAVSREVAIEMVAGALARTGADLAVAVTGVAGPGGGSADKPVGTVWLAWQRRGSEPRAIVCRFDGDREQVRRRTVEAALACLLELA